MNDKKNSITIKKYANRRLYNTATSSYVTLEDLSVMVKSNEHFNVYDAKSSEDITRSVLTQIIMEEENKSGQQNLLPTNFLRQLIGFYGNNLEWMVPKYLEHSMETLTGNQDQIQDYFKTSMGSMFPFGTTFEEMSKQNLSMFENTLRMLSPFGTGLGASTSSSPSSQPSKSQTCSSSSCSTLKSTEETRHTVQNQSLSSSSASSSKSSSSNSSCSISSPSPVKQPAKEESKIASISDIKPKKEKKKSKKEKSKKISHATLSKKEAQKAETPMPNVASVAASSSTGADDMQHKIANLQKQLADLAKSRA